MKVDDPPHRIEVAPAVRAQEPALANLLELYSYDLSDVADLHLAPDGRFHTFPNPARYWDDTRFSPFLIEVDATLAGLVIVGRGSAIRDDAGVWDMAEMFVVRRWRKKGVGAAAARTIWESFPGPWEVRVHEYNASALGFWGAAVHALTGERVTPTLVEQGGKRRHVFAFVAPGGADP